MPKMKLGTVLGPELSEAVVEKLTHRVTLLERLVVQLQVLDQLVHLVIELSSTTHIQIKFLSCE